MAVVNARMPYHTSLVPLFSVIFFYLLFKSLANSKYIPLLFLSLGFLLQVELSNIVVLGILFILFYRYRVKITIKQLALGLLAFVIGTLPFILYEFQNGFTYLKYPLWILNRIRLLFGLTSGNNSTLSSLPKAVGTIYQQVSGAVLPELAFLAVFLFVISVVVLLIHLKKTPKEKPIFVLILWLFVPLFAFLLHASPGTAYFSLVYPAIAISIGFLFSKIINLSRLGVLVFGVLISFNAYSIFSNNFYVTTQKGSNPMPPSMYNFGSSVQLAEETSKAIVKDAKGREFQLLAGGDLKIFKTSIDPYKYLIWYYGGRISENTKLKYVIFNEKNKIPENSNLIFTNELSGHVVRYD